MLQATHLRPSGLHEMISSVWGSDTMSYLHKRSHMMRRIAYCDKSSQGLPRYTSDFVVMDCSTKPAKENMLCFWHMKPSPGKSLRTHVLGRKGGTD